MSLYKREGLCVCVCVCVREYIPVGCSDYCWYNSPDRKSRSAVNVEALIKPSVTLSTTETSRLFSAYFPQLFNRANSNLQIDIPLLVPNITLLYFLSKKERKKRMQTYMDTHTISCLLYTSPSPRDISGSRMPSSA